MQNTYGTILNVSSDAGFLESVKEYLEDGGFAVLKADSFSSAENQLNGQMPDCVISALSPEEGRHELIGFLRKNAPEIPIVIVFHENDLSSLVDAIREGAWDFVLTPLKDMAVLEHVVCRALERSRLVVENKAYRELLEEKNKELYKHLTQLEEDQKAGKKLQQQLLPKSEEKIHGYELSYRMLPSLFLSGDFIDYFKIDENKIGFYIADVSGHGASSAFVTVLLKSIVDQLLEKFQEGTDETILSPDALLKKISDDVWQAKLGKYLTMIYGVIDCQSNKLDYSLGGHYPSPILFDGTESKFLSGAGFAVGILKDITFKSQTIKLPESFSLLMCSDGIMEILLGEKLLEKEDRLLHLISSFNKDLDDMIDQIALDTIESLPDDIALLMIKRESA